jgi:[1-hydroxy-2-(trimethylamino)ethyl]phosphonate dioxygenase
MACVVVRNLRDVASEERMTDPITSLTSIMAGQGQRRYGLHDVSQLQHALQAAMLAEQSGGGPALITAALLHDIGHMLQKLGDNPAKEGMDDRHEELGHDYLQRYFPAEVTDPVRRHVAAKRYLCATEPDYAAQLAPDSVLSLKLQGGPMSATEAARFLDEPHAEAAIALRRFDDMAKVKDLATPSLVHFLPYVASCLVVRPDT